MRRRDFIKIISGSAAAWPFAVRAQQAAMPMIGFLRTGSLIQVPYFVNAFRRGLKEADYVEGQNVVIEFRSADNQRDRLPALVADLLGRPVSVIAGDNVAALAAKAATKTIPIVFAGGGDPVQEGLVASLNRPGGNLTGVSNMFTELIPKRLELLADLTPQANVFALLVDPNLPGAERMIREGQEAARVKGMQLHIVKAGTESEIDAAFKALVELHLPALIVSVDAFLNNSRGQIVALAARYAVPTVYGVRDYVNAGGLMSYGTDLVDGYRQVGIYAGKILKGARPADLPIQQVTKVALVINLKTAKMLGLTIPTTLLGRADEVFE